MAEQPELGDAFGALMRAAWAGCTGVGVRPTVGGVRPVPAIEIVERDDGFISASPADKYLHGPDQWQPYDRRALARVGGRTLDIGAGAGRLALALQERGVEVVALDVSPGAVAVAADRGVRATVCATVDEHAERAASAYDCFAMFGNNLGLLESRQRAPGFLAALAAMARPGATIIAQGTDPYRTTDELHTAYHGRNRRLGRMPGQLRLRVRYRNLATAWFDYLLCSPEELAELVHASPWRVADVDQADQPFYLATLGLR
ncbi:MAG TPA: class I SAM-dependent methyltransferase [Micromonosporaceae bacterium]